MTLTTREIGGEAVIGNDEDIGLVADAARGQFLEHAGEIVVGAFHGLEGDGRARPGGMLGVVRLAEPQQGERRHFLVPHGADQRLRGCLVLARVRSFLGRERREAEPVDGGSRDGLVVKQIHAITAGPARFQAVEQNDDGLGSRDGGAFPGALQNFGDGGQVEVMIAGDLVAFADRLECLDFDALERIDVGSVLAIAEDAVAVRVRARGHGGGIDFRRTEIDRVMVLEEHAVARELIQCGGVRLRDEVRPHAVPDHHDDVLGLASRESCGGGGGEQDGQNNGKRTHGTTFYR